MAQFTIEEVAQTIRECVSLNIPPVDESDISTLGDVHDTIEVEFGATSRDDLWVDSSQYQEMANGHTGSTGVRVACVGMDLSSGKLYFKVINLTL